MKKLLFYGCWRKNMKTQKAWLYRFYLMFIFTLHQKVPTTFLLQPFLQLRGIRIPPWFRYWNPTSQFWSLTKASCASSLSSYLIRSIARWPSCSGVLGFTDTLLPPLVLLLWFSPFCRLRWGPWQEEPLGKGNMKALAPRSASHAHSPTRHHVRKMGYSAEAAGGAVRNCGKPWLHRQGARVLRERSSQFYQTPLAVHNFPGRTEKQNGKDKMTSLVLGADPFTKQLSTYYVQRTIPDLEDT